MEEDVGEDPEMPFGGGGVWVVVVETLSEVTRHADSVQQHQVRPSSGLFRAL